MRHEHTGSFLVTDARKRRAARYGVLVDRLACGDSAFPGTVRTQNASGRPGSSAALGANDPSLWVLSTVGDVEGFYRSLKNDIGSPGITAVVPEPETYALFLAGLGLLGVAAKRFR